MRNAFDIAQFETRLPGCPLTKTEFVQLPVEEKYEHASHLFANQVTNDGYGAPVLLCRPKTEAEKSGKKSIEGPVVPPRYVPTVVIGLDPGMQAICTAAREDFRSEEQQTRRRRRRRKRQPRRPQRRRGSTRKRKSNRPH
ncbi:hypothetical protein PC129_g13590 [Phytophthora cactorum]|uniref:Uncharacterized protein n=1 Tax=Phytophthora cactorum TaxID=29920 RepID=A0A8T0YVP3_9STRA|nr:hypothetical protein Pcac1_g8897 [Phytophthora cactorum]KAG2818137.1 hypothetical protein PC111_g12419 [Phytophthora cactorum]KAG2833224.1 hypothetical protein PC112_g6576 [Phytophthora cactorum]KAG2853725.1 hypothetical protein PC113_g13924 [Phytophthora cactorum]KAG2893233.1 hypothetical protein PC114_g16332 [Phytophthora cactorum]